MLIKQEMSDGTKRYINNFTGKQERLQRGSFIKGRRLPDYVFRYISPGKTPMSKESGIPSIPIMMLSNSKRKNTNMMKPRSRSRQKH